MNAREALVEIRDRLEAARAHTCAGYDCAICGPMAATSLQGVIDEALKDKPGEVAGGVYVRREGVTGEVLQRSDSTGGRYRVIFPADAPDRILIKRAVRLAERPIDQGGDIWEVVDYEPLATPAGRRS